MKIIKSIAKALWPVIVNQLYRLAEKTETPWDDWAVESADNLLKKWFETDFPEDDE